MASDMQTEKPKKRSGVKSVFTFIKVFFSVILIFALAASVFILAYDRMRPPGGQLTGQFEPDDFTRPEEEDMGGVISNFFVAPDLTSFLIAGFDEFLLTDVLVAGCFNASTNEINLISIPRDTFTTLSDEDVQTLTDAGRRIPAGGAMKINSVYAYAGKDAGIEYLKKQITKILGVEIDYYALIDLDGFKNIVDTMGGVYMRIRPQGLYYEDPDQGLVIAVPGGMQLLDGSMAEGVIRYRDDYARADIDRIDIQHEFMREFVKQALNKETIIKNAPSIAYLLLHYMQSDFAIDDALKYIRYLGELKDSNIHFHTLPGGTTNVGESYYLHDIEQTRLLVEKIFAEPPG